MLPLDAARFVDKSITYGDSKGETFTYLPELIQTLLSYMVASCTKFTIAAFPIFVVSISHFAVWPTSVSKLMVYIVLQKVQQMMMIAMRNDKVQIIHSATTTDDVDSFRPCNDPNHEKIDHQAGKRSLTRAPS